MLRAISIWRPRTETFDANSGGINYSDSVMKLSSSGTVLDYFTPSNESMLALDDVDLGSSPAMVLPDSVGSAAHPHLLLATGKPGYLFLLDRDQFGKVQLSPEPGPAGSSRPAQYPVQNRRGRFWQPCLLERQHLRRGEHGFPEALHHRERRNFGHPAFAIHRRLQSPRYVALSLGERNKRRNRLGDRHQRLSNRDPPDPRY